jgi:DNA-binding MarR family transcriptional regulator
MTVSQESSADGEAPSSPPVPSASASNAIEVLEALRAYRAADAAMRRRTGNAMGISESDFLALRFVVANDESGRVTYAKDLARYMGISSASTSSLIDRLVRRGYVERRPSEHDHRSVEVVPVRNEQGDGAFAISDTHQQVIAAASSLSPEEMAVVTRFLNGMRGAVDAID